MLNVCDVGLMEVLLIGDLVFFLSFKVKGVGGWPDSQKPESCA